MDNLRLWNASLGQVAIMTNMFDYIHEDNIYLPYLIAEYLFDGGSSNPALLSDNISAANPESVVIIGLPINIPIKDDIGPALNLLDIKK